MSAQPPLPPPRQLRALRALHALRQLPTFWRHLLTVLSGAVAAQALPILAAPLITRLCTPADLGAFSVWFGVAAITAVAATLRMENAMVIDHGRIRQRLCFSVVAWSAGWLAVALTAAAAGARLAGLTAMAWPAVLTVGLAAWLIATMQTTLAYAASHNAFAPAAKARVWAAGGIAAAQLALLASGVGGGAAPLVAGHVLGLGAGLLAARRLLDPPLRTRRRPISLHPAPVPILTAATPPQQVPAPWPLPRMLTRRLPRMLRLLPRMLTRRLPRPLPRLLQGWLPRWLPRLLRRLRRRGLAALLPGAAQRRFLRTHRAFWHFTLPSDVLNAGISQLPVLIIGARHGAAAAGLFALTQRVMAAPISVLAASVLEVFKREAARQYQSTGNCRPAYLQALRVLVLLGLGPSLLLLASAPELFALAFGENWRPAGDFSQLMAPQAFLNFVASPLSYVFAVAGRQKSDLLWQIALLTMVLCAFTAPLSLRHSVMAYTIGYSLLYLVYLHLSYRYAANRPPPGSWHGAR